MPLSRLFYWLFGAALIVLSLLLGYGWLLTYRAEDKKLQDSVNEIVQRTAKKVQQQNFLSHGLLNAMSDKEYKEKMAFAAGMTQNQADISMQFDTDVAPSSHTSTHNKKNPDSVTLTVYPQGKEPVKYNYSKKSLHMASSGRPVSSLEISHELPAGKNTSHDSSKNHVNAPTESTMKNKGDSYTINLMDSGNHANAAKGIVFFDSSLKTRLATENINIPWHTQKVIRRVDTTRWASGMFIINFYQPDIYRVVYTLPRSLLIKHTLPYTSIAFLLLALVSGGFLLYSKSYRMQMQMTQFKESLFSNVTHELKTPLSSLQLIIGSLPSQGTELSAKQMEYIDFAGKELQRMNLLIEKILSFGKLNKEQFALNKEVINLTALIHEAIRVMNIKAGSKDADVRFDAPGDIDVIGDKILLLNMLVSIIDNAIKYTTAQPVIDISLVQLDREVRISIRDNGIGINPKFLARIFDPFFRVPVGNEHSVKGHGLGLSFAQQVVKLHSGSISAESEPGKGSTFFITLPS